MGCVGTGLGLYVGNLQVLWGVLEPVWAVCWQPTGLVGCVGTSLVLNVGKLQVLWVCWRPVRGCMLVTHGVCWNWLGAVCWKPTGLMGCVGGQFGAVCWQPAGLMGCVGTGLGLNVGNLRVLRGMLEPV